MDNEKNIQIQIEENGNTTFIYPVTFAENITFEDVNVKDELDRIEKMLGIKK